MDVAAWTDAQSEADLRARGSLKWSGTEPGMIGAWVAEMDLPLAPAITAALHKAADQGLTGYLPAYLDAEVGRATALWQARYGWDIDPADVHPVASVVGGVADRHRPADRPDRAGGAAGAGLHAVPDGAGPVGAGADTVPMRIVGDRYQLDLPAIAAALTPGALFVLTNPHNPTGRVFTVDELLALADVVDDAGATVFADEIHAPLVYPGHTHRPYAALSARTAAHTITGTSASKGWNIPGLGCGQLILSSDETRDRWARLNPVVWYGATPTGAVATVAAYTEGGEHLAAVLDYLRVGRDLFAGSDRRSPALGPGCSRCEGTYLGWLDLRESGCDPADVAALTGVRGVDGRLCGTPGFLRLNLAMPHHLLREMASRLATLRPAS